MLFSFFCSIFFLLCKVFFFKLSFVKLGGFKYFLFLLVLVFGENFQFDEYFSDGLKPPTRKLVLG